jgi:hypothetical protein
MAFRIRDLAVGLELGRQDGLFLSTCTQPSCTGQASDVPSSSCDDKKHPPKPKPGSKYVPGAEVSDLALLQQQLRQSFSLTL